MKKLFYCLSFVSVFAFTFINSSFAQIQTPAPSPAAKVMQTVGLTDVHVEYSRPSMKGRAIFADNGLVPFGEVWRTGANSATKITFDGDVKVGGKELKKGSYAILTKPSATSWDFHFYAHDGGNWGSYVEKTPDAVATAKPKRTGSPVETFLITFGATTSNSSKLQFAWENTVVAIDIETNVHDQVMAQIEKVMAGPTNGDYYAAGVYMANNDGDLNQALMYVQKATHAENPRYWQLRQESLILAKLGKNKEAIAVAKKSLQLATEAGNKDYIKMNNDSIKKWSM